MIEKAEVSDAQQIASMIKASIRTCVADHENDPQAIELWLANKTESNIKQWISQNFALVFKQGAQITGFILVSPTGEVLLNYVDPNSQRQGIGKVLLSQVKDEYLKRGIHSLSAESTLTAKPFYLANGFKVVEEIYENGKLVAYQMRAKL